MGICNDHTGGVYAADALFFRNSLNIVQILTGKNPFAEVPADLRVIGRVLIDKARPRRPDTFRVTDAIWTLLEYCWNEDPSARPDACHVGLVLDIIYGSGHEIDSSTVLAVLDGVLDDVEIYQKTTSRTEVTMPYICKWSHCCEGFDSLDICIEHECAELNMRSVGVPK